MSQVFCKDCRYYQRSDVFSVPGMVKVIPQACVATKRADPVRGVVVERADPLIRNAGFDCSLYERKRYWRRRLREWIS